MPDIYWEKNAVVGVTASTAGFSSQRQAEESDAGSTNTTSSQILSARYLRQSGRGSPVYSFYRSFMAFDFTGYTTGTMTNLAWHWKGTTASNGANNVFLVKTSAFGSNTNFNNYASTSWWSSIAMGTRYDNGGLGGFSWPDSTSAQSVSLLSSAITAGQSDGYLQMVLVTAVDYFGLDSGADQTRNSYGNWSSNNMFLRFTYADAGYPNTVNSITSANISKINSIATANISKVNSVD